MVTFALAQRFGVGVEEKDKGSPPGPGPRQGARRGWVVFGPGSALWPACLVLDREPGSPGIGPQDPSPGLFPTCPADRGLTPPCFQKALDFSVPLCP